jgi:aryl-alcohol dehydrogenase-like predicted oxidoreductase
MMKTKSLGTQGLTASELGLGCMGMSEFYGATDDAESIKTIHKAIESGINFLDTADVYGPFKNEELVGKAIKGKRDKLTICTKFGIVRDPENPQSRGVNGKPEYVKSASEASLKRLDIDVIDLYEAMGQLVKEGKVRAIGLSEVSPNTLRRAHAVFPITALQTEYSLWTRDPEDEIIDTCKELGIAFVAYSPLGRGFLAGQIKKFEDLASDDYRRFVPRFQGENFKKNLDLVYKLEELAAVKNCTASQLALAWVLAQGNHIFPIPGTKRIKYLEENIGALNIQLTDRELKEINDTFPKDAAVGLRYTEQMMNTVNR